MQAVESLHEQWKTLFRFWDGERSQTLAVATAADDMRKILAQMRTAFCDRHDLTENVGIDRLLTASTEEQMSYSLFGQNILHVTTPFVEYDDPRKHYAETFRHGVSALVYRTITWRKIEAFRDPWQVYDGLCLSGLMPHHDGDDFSLKPVFLPYDHVEIIDWSKLLD